MQSSWLLTTERPRFRRWRTRWPQGDESTSSWWTSSWFDERRLSGLWFWKLLKPYYNFWIVGNEWTWSCSCDAGGIAIPRDHFRCLEYAHLMHCIYILKDHNICTFCRSIKGITGNVLAEDIHHFISNGANEVLSKPLTKSKLLSALNHYGRIQAFQALDQHIQYHTDTLTCDVWWKLYQTNRSFAKFEDDS